MSDLVIVGTKGQARETHAVLESLVEAGASWNVLGFVDDAPDHGEVHALPVVGSIDWLESRPEVAVAVGIGSTGVRAQVVERISGYGPRLFPALIHPDASVGRRVDIGEGTVVCAGTILTTDIKIGAHVLLNFGCTVGHDAVIGDMVTVGPGAHVSGAVRVGRDTYIGTGASIIQSIEIGERAVIGAGAAVIRDVPDDRTAVGVPARVLDPRDDR